MPGGRMTGRPTGLLGTRLAVVSAWCEGVHVETGVFGARMEVALVDYGPVTLSLEL
jgi:D-Tyr-tRNAtyr deacylase